MILSVALAKALADEIVKMSLQTIIQDASIAKNVIVQLTYNSPISSRCCNVHARAAKAAFATITALP
jgi:hypothetical protein